MVNKSIRTWVLAFLSIDLLFWLLVGYSCITDRVSCLESVSFGAYFFYLPFSLIPLPVPGPFWLIIPVWVILHGLLGALVGWLLRDHPVRWWLAGIISLIVLVGVPYGLGKWQMQEELTRETTTKLWLVYEASDTELQFGTGELLPDGTLGLDEGTITNNLAAFDTSNTQVILLKCDQPNCAQGETVSYTDYLAAKTACHEDKTTCPYNNLEYPTLFEVTSNPIAIITMKQMPLPQSSIPLE